MYDFYYAVSKSKHLFIYIYIYMYVCMCVCVFELDLFIWLSTYKQIIIYVFSPFLSFLSNDIKAISSPSNKLT